MKYRCGVCGFVYDPSQGDPKQNVAPATAFAKLPQNWRCPICGADKREFTAEE